MVGFWHWHIPAFIITDISPPWWDFVMVGICWVTKIFRVLDCSESAFDDKMARILTGQSQIQVIAVNLKITNTGQKSTTNNYSDDTFQWNQNQKYSVAQVRGPLIREVAVKGGQAVYQKNKQQFELDNNSSILLIARSATFTFYKAFHIFNFPVDVLAQACKASLVLLDLRRTKITFRCPLQQHQYMTRPQNNINNNIIT